MHRPRADTCVDSGARARHVSRVTLSSQGVSCEHHEYTEVLLALGAGDVPDVF